MSNDLNARLAAIAKKWGEDAVLRFGDIEKKHVEAISSGCLAIDIATQVGGYPKAAITELFGVECLHADSFIQYEVRTKDGCRQNQKGGTLKRLYDRFHGIARPGKGNYQRPQTAHSDFFVPSMNKKERVFKNRVVDVVKCGKKGCLRIITESGRSLVATPEHKFYIGNGFVTLSELEAGDEIFVHNNIPFSCEHAPRKHYKEVLVKNHPHWAEKVIDGRYHYRRGRVSHAVYEAWVNGIPYADYIRLLNTADLLDLDGLWYVPDNHEIHHVDGDPSNDIVENLALMSRQEHGRLHAYKSHNNLRFIVTRDTIVSIEDAGETETYDIVCQSPNNNYIANGIVVHNSSGKTTLALWFLAHVQKMGGTCAFVNTEQKCDPDYIRTLISTYGGDADEVLVSTPTCGEEALDIVERLIGVVDAVVLDSIADLVTQAELEADDTRANFVGIQARLITKALKRIKPKLGLSDTALLFTNQTRANIGGFGSSETTGGGRALRHAEMLRLRISMRGVATRSSGQQVGIPCKAKVRKNQVGKPGETAEFDIIWGEGLDLCKDTFEGAKATGVIEMTAGGYYHYDWPGGEERIQGKEAVKNILRANPDLMEQVRAAASEAICSRE